MRDGLHGHVAVITGASSGIGRAAAALFASRGASVVLAARGEPALQATADEVEAAGGQALVVPTDVADAEQVQALAVAALERFGRIDTWLNGASVATYGELVDVPADIAQTLRVNLMGQVHGLESAVTVMRQQGSGTVIAIGSGLGARPVPLQAPCCASERGGGSWAHSAQSMIPSPPTPEAVQAVPEPTELVDRGFEITEQLLAAQDVSAAGAASAQTAADGAAQAGDSITQTVKNAFSKD